MVSESPFRFGQVVVKHSLVHDASSNGTRCVLICIDREGSEGRHWLNYDERGRGYYTKECNLRAESGPW